MTAGSDSAPAVAGGLARHIPVLGRSAVECLAVRRGGVYLDATFGGGGYSRMILAVPDARVIAIDRDPQALAQGAVLADGCRLVLAQDTFANIAAVLARLGIALVDGIVFDLGVSSLQLDTPAQARPVSAMSTCG